MIHLTTQRLIIRDPELDDFDGWHRLLSDARSMYYLPDIATRTQEESCHNLEAAIADIMKPDRTKYFLAIEERETGSFIGTVGYTVRETTPAGKSVGAGYFILPEFQGKGYVTEAFTEVIRFAFEEDNVYRIETGCITENLASERVMQKCGLVKETYKRKQKSMLKKHNIVIWYLLTFVFTGVLLPLHFIFETAGEYSVAFTQFGPMLATLLLIMLMKDSDAASIIKYGLRLQKRTIHWYILSAVLPVALVGACALLLTPVFGSEYIPWEGTPVFYTMSITAIFAGSIGEEIGWRGYLMPSLSKKFSPLVSSIITGCLWGFWHVQYASDIVFWLLFIVTAIELSVIYTFILHKSDGNLWTAIIFHALFNLANRMFVWERFDTQLMISEVVVFGISAGIVIAIDKRRRIFNT